MDPIKVFWVKRTDRAKAYLRRYRSSVKSACSNGPYCNAKIPCGEVPIARDAAGFELPREEPMRDDPRWPTKCDHCGKAFEATDPFQLFTDTIYRAADGREWGRRDLPPGASYHAFWLADQPDYCGPDGLSVMVVLPTPDRHEWCVDSRASNCTLPADNEHRCWVRHGDPKTGDLHVDKAGKTCAAGAGSIDVPGFHGYLHHGYLRKC